MLSSKPYIYWLINYELHHLSQTHKFPLTFFIFILPKFLSLSFHRWLNKSHSKLTSFASEEIGFVYGFKNDLRRLQTTLSTIKAILLDAEEKQEQSHAVKDWIKRLKDVVYDADDLLDDVATEGLRRKVEGQGRIVRKVCDFFSSSNQIAFRFKMGNRIKDLRERLDEVANDLSGFRFIVRKEVGVDMRVKNSWRETDSFVQESEMIGRDGDKKKIIESLLCPDNQSNVSVVAIVGFGGLGKTALAQLVYNDEKVMNYFDLKMWACVSEESNIEMIVKIILKSANIEVSNSSLEQLQIRLRQHLERKKYLMVLDDVWNVDYRIWSQLRKYLMVGAIGSKILVTTRNKSVALAMGVNSPYALGGLTEDQSWDLFEKLVFREGTSRVNPNLIEIGKKIAKKCKGVPLAIRALGGIMQLKSRESDEWLSVLENEIWKLFESKNDVGPVLKLSYDHLPNHLKQCFAYCAMFPKDYEFDKETLIQLWMAQGYVQCWSQSGNESLEEIGDGYFNELLFKSFFQKDEHGYKMHDIIHDLAQSIAGDSCFVVNDTTKDIPDRVQHVYFEGLPSEECLRKFKNKGLRTLFFSRELDINLDSIISNCRSLCVLSLRGWYIDGLPDSIGKLKHLRYLDISRNQIIESLPNCICSLYNLQTLILSDYWVLRELPRDIRKLICLRSLMIDECNRLEYMPVGLGRLTSLKRLSNFIVGRDQGRRCATLNELNSLNQLSGEISIELRGNVRSAALESNQVNLKEKKHLHSLDLYFYWSGTGDIDSGNSELLLDNLHPHPNLKQLHVNGYEGVRFSNWLSSITNLVDIDIRACPKCEHLPPLDRLPSLKSLRLDEFNSLNYISDEMAESSSFSSASTTFFPSLKILQLIYCPNLKGWWRTCRDADLVPQFPCLSHLTIRNCPNLTLMPTFPSLDMDLYLSNANIRPLHQTLKMKIMTATASTLPSTSSSVTASFPKLKSLYLEEIEGLSSLPGEWMQNLISLKNLTVSYLSSLVSLPRELRHVTTLQHLEISDCSNLTALPDWMGNLTSLEYLQIKNCPKLESLPKIGPTFLTSHIS
ncbi:putative disease resistance protein RGA1 isoform X2 [Hevea brasiliensis]|uniref:putative disease resistance protein RGA1 isoform X2 n=1 Tax=Hevea brasiliensis TaxID=3981 RepID=UPI0025FCF0DE|nr:putative disease resistance protein RGA1 isoform X2 [Hevea brasiliensis]